MPIPAGIAAAAAPPPPPPQISYEFRAGFHSCIAAATIAERIAYLRQKLGRAPTWRDVLDDARDPCSPIHDHFDWDNDVAAEHWRELQAKQLVAAVRIKFQGHDEQAYFLPAFVSHADVGGQRVIVRVQEALDEDHRDTTLADLIRQWRGLMGRARHMGFDELNFLFEVIDDLYVTYCT
jgi:hypothetical protein